MDLDRYNHSGRVFAYTLAGGFTFVALIGMWRDNQFLTTAAVVLAVASVIAGTLFPGRLEPARTAWMKLGEAIGRVTTPILMAVIYYIILTPTGLLRRLLRRRQRGGGASYWHARPPMPPRSRMERQF